MSKLNDILKVFTKTTAKLDKFIKDNNKETIRLRKVSERVHKLELYTVEQSIKAVKVRKKIGELLE